MHQIGIEVDVSPQEVAREKTLGGAISLCAKAAGLTPKQVQTALKAHRSQFSRWKDDQEGITWDKFAALMDLCGNDAPLKWMLHARGYEISSLRKRKSETERALEAERQGRLEAEKKLKYFEELVMGRKAAL